MEETFAYFRLAAATNSHCQREGRSEKYRVHTLRFDVTMCHDTGGFVARWNDPGGGGITTQGDSFAELDAMVRDAVEGYFADRDKPTVLRLHFLDDPVLSVA